MGDDPDLEDPVAHVPGGRLEVEGLVEDGVVVAEGVAGLVGAPLAPLVW